MAFAGFSPQAVQFLSELSRNNERAWFEAHQEDCERFVIEPAKALVEALGARLRQLDPKLQAVPKLRGSIKALERRRRFPNRTQPLYKPHLDLWFWSGRRRAWDNSGFFLRLGPERLSLAAGMIEFQKPTLGRYREHVLAEERGSALASIVDALRADGCVVGGETYKRTPPRVSADHPRAALLKHSALFGVLESAHPSQLCTPDFVDFSYQQFARLAPLHGWLVRLGEP